MIEPAGGSLAPAAPTRSAPHPSGAALADYFRLPAEFASLGLADGLSDRAGYFRFQGSVCYGRPAGARPSSDVTSALPDVSQAVAVRDGRTVLPFDFDEVVTNLRQERYRLNGYRLLERVSSTVAARHAYYFLRPLLKVGVRKHLQKIRLRGWERIQFPRWPVDTTVDDLMASGLVQILKASGVSRIPFIWFWPDGAQSCLVLTHDVEGEEGHRFCDELMDIDESFGFKSAFQLIPHGQEQIWRRTADKLRARGFEVNLHDLNHDGYLFHDRQEFERRAKLINQYARHFNCGGFRSGAMYRQQGWYDALELSYDMSVPNVAHLEPQRGGCCTVMPYFVGDVLELPLTTIQDYSLFHILGDYSTALWRQQMEAILERNGLMTFLAHPDYLADPPALRVYAGLLSHIADLRARAGVWTALPAEADRWWRSRRQMRLVPHAGSWRIEGSGAHRATLAYATLDGDRVHYALAEAG